MLFSTAHWQPLVNGYSDHIPADFRKPHFVLDSFPSNDTLRACCAGRVRYISDSLGHVRPRQTEIRGAARAVRALSARAGVGRTDDVRIDADGADRCLSPAFHGRRGRRLLDR